VKCLDAEIHGPHRVQYDGAEPFDCSGRIERFVKIPTSRVCGAPIGDYTCMKPLGHDGPHDHTAWPWPVEAPTRRYCVQPGPVISKSDGDMHRIGVGALIRLYGLQKGQYMIHRDMDPRACDGLEHLGPRYDGEYPNLGAL
jgi:hypothetical protein